MSKLPSPKLQPSCLPSSEDHARQPIWDLTHSTGRGAGKSLVMEIQELMRWLTSLVFVSSICSSSWTVVDGSRIEDRVLTYRETSGNYTFECSASGACVPCSYSEKSDEKFHCSETGYRMPYKCVEVKSTLKESNKEQIQDRFSVKEETQSGTAGGYKDAPSEEQTQKRQDQNTKGNNGNWRRLLESTYALEDEKQTYHIFKSCIPVAEEEKLSVLGFEAIVLFLLLICSPVVYYRKKRSFVISGATRIPTNARF